MGSPKYMDLLLNNTEWLLNMLTVNVTLMNQLVHGGGEVLQFNKKWFIDPKGKKAIAGTEGFLLSWLLWTHIPMGELPIKGQNKLMFGKLKLPEAYAYCEKKFLQITKWVNVPCVLGAEGFPTKKKYGFPTPKKVRFGIKRIRTAHNKYEEESYNIIQEELQKECNLFFQNITVD